MENAREDELEQTGHIWKATETMDIRGGLIDYIERVTDRKAQKFATACILCLVAFYTDINTPATPKRKRLLCSFQPLHFHKPQTQT